MALAGAVGPGVRSPISKKIKEELGLKEELAPSSKIKKISSILQGKAIKKALSIIDGFTEEHGDFGGNSCTAMNVLLALHRMNLQNEDRFKKGLKALLNYAVQAESEWRMQTCQSHVWDTGFSLLALSKLKDERGSLWLKQRQIKDIFGQWNCNVKAEPGGWCFGDRHDHYPVTDCSAMAIMAVEKNDETFLNSNDGKRALKWLLAMQHESGGWSAYQKYERGQFLNKILKFKDIPEALVDLPKADVSAKVLEAICLYKNNDEAQAGIKKGREFLLSKREENLLWKGNYGINFIYGTSFITSA